MSVPCDCCEGTEVLTPQNVANRPGLEALSYRIGTHATFLETMKARLSTAEFKELEKLTTRAASDPAIAWLDAWATVADVLTFYQERIANEGYLRTATERRSILELARLVGYSLRPGVAASVYLAYTLEDGQQVEIPAGAQAQSVPGPGELPQTFETTTKVETRGDWNTLQIRLTRPLDPVATADANGPLYFKGADTKLKPNDLLLIDPGDQPPLLIRVLTVTPDQAAARTKVTIQSWTAEPADHETRDREARSFAAAPVAENVARVQQSLERFVSAEGFDVNTSTQTAQRVIESLTKLSKEISSVASNLELQAELDATLVILREEHRLATLGNFTKLLPWIAAIIAGLDQFSEALGVARTDVSNGDTATVPLAEISRVIAGLEKPASRPAANSAELPRSVSNTFAPTSDALPKLLVAMRAGLSENLYSAWKNLRVTDSEPARVYALRTRALVFGHNAPLKLITDLQTGRVTGAEEWPLFRTVAIPFTETFEIDNRVSVDASVSTTITISKDGVPTTGGGKGLLNPQPGKFNVNVGTELVKVTVLGGPTSDDITRMEYEFTQRGFSIVAERHSPAFTATSSVVGPPRVVIRDLAVSANGFLKITGTVENLVTRIPTEEPKKVSLDASYKDILPGSWAVLERPGEPNLLVTHVDRVREASRADYGIAGSGTQLELSNPWIAPLSDTFGIIRGTTVFAQSELLELAEAPIDPLAEPLCRNELELTELVDGLESGRWLIVSGERADITHPPPGQNSGTQNAGPSKDNGNAESVREVLRGVTSSELVMLAGVEQGYDSNLSGDKTHSTLLLSPGLEYCYKRDTVTIYGNVIEATHGETRNEVLGSGDGSQPLQQFELLQSPVTFVAAPTTSGVESTLQVRVNDVQWHETQSLDALKPAARNFITRTDDKDEMKVIFGDGVHGARLPTGVENVKAVYRTGIGKPGNVKAGQIQNPVTRPLGVKAVTNPLRASGGADRENRDSARRNAPLAVMSLDRLVSTKDYEDFTRTFAGIGKASAARLSDGQRQLVHLTIAGEGDIPIDENSALYRNLLQSLHRFGDPFQAVQVDKRELMLLVISAKVRVLPDYQFETVAPKIRAALLARFGFDRRELGQSVFSSEIISAIQNIEGVAWADLDVLDSVSESEILSPSKLAAKLGNLVTRASGSGARPNQFIHVRNAEPGSQGRCGNITKSGICPAQLAFLSPDVSDTLILTEHSS